MTRPAPQSPYATTATDLGRTLSGIKDQVLEAGSLRGAEPERQTYRGWTIEFRPARPRDGRVFAVWEFTDEHGERLGCAMSPAHCRTQINEKTAEDEEQVE